jgi:signal transduction histidine kinase
MISLPAIPQAPGSGRALLLRSLRVRLLVATVAGVAVALAAAGFVLGGIFSDHVRQQFVLGLTEQLDQITSRLSVDAAGRPVIDPQTLSDPRWQRPYSGLYWQVDEISRDGLGRAAVLRSRSLWDSQLPLASDTLIDGAVHVHEAAGPNGAALLLLERTVRIADQPESRWRLIVGADLKDTREAIARFGRVLGTSLFALLILLALAAWAQLAVGLRPLRVLQRRLDDVQHAIAPRLQGRFPSEVQPLVDDFNRVLDQNRIVVERARTQAGNLAHALKTPLSVLDQAAARELSSGGSGLARLVQEQVVAARRQIDWHLARARVSATQRLPGQRTDVGRTVNGLVRVMERVHAHRGLAIDVQIHADASKALYFAGEEQDLQEMLGNLLDNACKWAGRRVVVTAARQPKADPPQLSITVQDDGPGIDESHLSAAMDRGTRLDESVAGSGLGLAITHELAGLYGGRLQLQRGAAGGLVATLELPAI